MTPDLHQAAEVLRIARDRGVNLWAEEGRLQFKSTRPLSPDLVGLLKAWKHPLLCYLKDSTLGALCAGLPLEEAQELREERAAIMEYDGGMSREDAERLAGLHPLEAAS